MKKSRLIAPLLLLLLLFASFTSLTGCGSKRPANSEVSGKVTYAGAPVGGGNITFHTKDGAYSASLNSEGYYIVADMPDGESVVTIETESINPERKSPDYASKAGSGPKSGQYAMPGGGKAGAPQYGGVKAGQQAPGGAVGAATGPPKSATKGAKTVSPVGEGVPQGDPGHYTKIPQKYGDKTKSPLKVMVNSGSQTQNFDLTD